jgi:predicted nucleic acid-binding Zn ribbon protein
MIYQYVCVACGNEQDEQCSVNSFKEFRPPCTECGSECAYQFNPSGVQFILKDGPSGSWPSKGNRVKQQRAKASEAAGRRQHERYSTPKLVPNFEGKETESWKDAQSEALKEKGPEAATTYEQKVQTEVQAEPK